MFYNFITFHRNPHYLRNFNVQISSTKQNENISIKAESNLNIRLHLVLTESWPSLLSQ
jgi:hypothetical protein